MAATIQVVHPSMRSRRRVPLGSRFDTIGMGSQDEPVDVGIIDVIRPESVAADGVLSGEIIVKTSGISQPPAAPQTVNIRIESNGKSFWRPSVPFPANSSPCRFLWM